MASTLREEVRTVALSMFTPWHIPSPNASLSEQRSTSGPFHSICERNELPEILQSLSLPGRCCSPYPIRASTISARICGM